MTLDQQYRMLWAQRETAKANVEIAETAVAAAERELQRIDAELDRISDLQWQEMDTERRMRRFA